MSNCSLELPFQDKTIEMLQRGDNTIHLDVAPIVVRLGGDALEMRLRCTAKSVNKEGRTLFLVEVVQSGIFILRNLNLPPEELALVEHAQTAAIVHPFLRAHLHDLLARAGLPTFLLPEINYRVLHEQKRRAEVESRAAIASEAKKLH